MNSGNEIIISVSLLSLRNLYTYYCDLHELIIYFDDLGFYALKFLISDKWLLTINYQVNKRIQLSIWSQRKISNKL